MPPESPDRPLTGTDTLVLPPALGEATLVLPPEGEETPGVSGLATLVLPSAPVPSPPPPRAGGSATLILESPDTAVPKTPETPDLIDPFSPMGSGRKSNTLPDRIGRFLIEDELGEGAFGVVYKATDPVLDRTVALKVAKPDMVNTPDKVARFLREAKTAANLRHPNIVPVFDSGQDDGRYFIASAFISGQTLRAAQEAANGPLDFRRAAEILRKVADAVAYAHARGVIHRDIKPENVMLDAGGEPLVMDFGIAAREGDAKLTSDGSGIGTPAYMAPEQSLGKGVAASDQYSLGCTLYHLLTGHTVFDGGAMQQVFLHQTEKPKPPRAVNPAISKDLNRIVLKCLEKAPRDRYPSCGELAEDLRRWLAGETVVARPPGSIERLAKWGRRNPLVAASLMLTFVVLTAATFVLIHQRDVALAAEQTAKRRLDSLQRLDDELKSLENRMAEADQFNRKVMDELYVVRSKLGDAYPSPEEVEQWRQERVVGRPSDAAPFSSNLHPWAVAALVDDARKKLTAGDPEKAKKKLFTVPVSARNPLWHSIARECDASLFTMYGHAGIVFAIAATPDGSRIVTGSQDRTARVWDARTGLPKADLIGHADSVMTLAVSPDSTRVLTGSADKTARLWDIRSGRTQRELKGHTATVTGVAFLPGSKQAVTCSDDKTVRIWDLVTGLELRKLEGHTEPVKAIAVTPDGEYLLTASADQTVRVWPLLKKDVAVREILGHKAPVTSVAVTPDGLHLVTGSEDKTVRLWNFTTGELIREFPGHTEDIRSVAVSPDGTTVATAATNRVIRLYERDTGKLLGTRVGHTDYVAGVCFLADGFRFGSAGFDRTARVWDIRPRFDPTPSRVMASLTRMLFHLSGMPIQPKIRWQLTDLWSVTDPAPIEIAGHGDVINVFAMTPDGRFAVTGSKDKTARVWDATTGRLLTDLKGHKDEITAVAITPDGLNVVTGSKDKSGRLWNARTGETKMIFPGVGDHFLHQVSRIAITPDVQTLVTQTDSGCVRVWNISTGKARLELNVQHVVSMALTPDGSRLALGCADFSPDDGPERFAHIYETEKGTCLFTLKAHRNRVNAIAITPDGRRIVTGSWDRTAKVWDGRTGNLLHTYPHDDQITDVAITPDGERVTTIQRSALLTTWRGSGREPVAEGDRRWLPVVTIGKVTLYPVGPNRLELTARLLASAPSPADHRAEIVRLTAAGNKYAVRVQESLEQRALGQQAIADGDYVGGFWKLVNAELLRP